MKNERKSGMVTTEVAIGIALSVVVLLVAVSLFNGNLSDMMKAANLGGHFDKNDVSAQYDSFSPDYSKAGSQIEVQIVGAQGLKQLRKQANNKALDLIADPSSGKNANSIAYYALVIKSIVGQPDACVRMKKDSKQFCNEKVTDNVTNTEITIGGYNYAIDQSGAELTLTKLYTDGSPTSSPPVSYHIDSDVASVLGSATVPLTSDGRSAFTTEQQYKFMKDLSAKLEVLDNFDKSVLLVRADTVTFASAAIVPVASSTPAPAATTPAIMSSFNALFEAIKTSASEAYNACSEKSGLGEYGNYKYYGCNGYYRISEDDIKTIADWRTNLSKELNALSNSSTTTSAAAALFANSLADGKIVSILKNDNFHSNNEKSDGSACNVLKTQLTSINTNYALNISIPECTPSGTKGTGIAAAYGDAATAVVSGVTAAVDAVSDAVSTAATAVADTVSNAVSTVCSWFHW